MHLKFPGLARMLNLYCIFVYSVIDPSGTFILGLVLAADLLLLVLGGSVTGRGLRRKHLKFMGFSVYSLSINLDPVLVILLLSIISWFWNLKLHLVGFSVKFLFSFPCGHV